MNTNAAKANNETEVKVKMEVVETAVSKILSSPCNVFNQRLKEILSGSNKNYSALDLGMSNDIHSSCNIPILPIQVSVKTITAKALQSDHPFSLVNIMDMPDYVADPIAIFRSATHADDSKVILTEMVSKGTNFVVILKPNQVVKGININDIRSVYPKTNIRPILEWICVHNLMEYGNKQKVLNWLGKHQYNPDEVTKLIKDTTNVINTM